MQGQYDTARTEWLKDRGYRVIRFTNNEVRRQLPAALEAIMAACEGEWVVSPLPGRERGQGRGLATQGRQQCDD
jgi:hypothetical protein